MLTLYLASALLVFTFSGLLAYVQGEPSVTSRTRKSHSAARSRSTMTNATHVASA
jgi:hypothetical protein